jgi:hypothetical protein
VTLAKTIVSCSVLTLGLALLVGGSAIAAPNAPKGPISPIGPTKNLPKGHDAPKTADLGLKSTAVVNPGQLKATGATMDIINAHAIRTSTDEVLMTDKTQLVLRFWASPNREYRLVCKFTANSQFTVLVQTETGTFVQQSQHGVANGRIVQIIDPKPGNRQLKIHMQGSKNSNWTECSINPT